MCVCIFARSLFINAAWNYKKMQNIGFVYALSPLAGPFAEKGQRLLTRHTDTFSTHPYMASLIIGSIAKLEANNEQECPEALRQKQALMGPFAAMGDPFFWGTLRPTAGIIAVIMALSGYSCAPILFFMLYNAVHFWIRGNGFIEASRDGAGALEFLRRIRLPEKTQKIKWFSLVLLAFLAGSFFIRWQPLCSMFPDVITGLSILAVSMVCLFLRSRRVSSLAILYGGSILFFLIAL